MRGECENRRKQSVRHCDRELNITGKSALLRETRRKSVRTEQQRLNRSSVDRICNRVNVEAGDKSPLAAESRIPSRDVEGHYGVRAGSVKRQIRAREKKIGNSMP